jgi:two-component system, NarL family, sensor kinase
MREKAGARAAGWVRGGAARRGARVLGSLELQNEPMLREVLKGLSVGVATASRAGRILFANARFAEILGVHAFRDITGALLHNFIGSDSWGSLNVALGVAAHYPTEGELRVETSSSKPRTIRLSLAPLQFENSREIRIVATDITEFAEANEILRKTEASLHSLSGRILHVQDEERRRIARDLHDTTGQELAVVVMALTRLVKSLEEPGIDVRKAVSDAANMVRKVEQEVRTLSYLLHPPLLDELGLASALRWYAEGINKRGVIRVSVEVPPKMQRISKEKEMALFRVVQESLTNVLRHSGSPSARIEVGEWADQVQVSIEDEGRGIEREMLERIVNGKEPIGVGLAGIRERLSQFGGKLEVHSGQVGTRVVASVPASEDPDAEKAGQSPAEAV